jgi:hypothetical protein
MSSESLESDLVEIKVYNPMQSREDHDLDDLARHCFLISRKHNGRTMTIFEFTCVMLAHGAEGRP